MADPGKGRCEISSTIRVVIHRFDIVGYEIT